MIWDLQELFVEDHHCWVNCLFDKSGSECEFYDLGELVWGVEES